MADYQGHCQNCSWGHSAPAWDDVAEQARIHIVTLDHCVAVSLVDEGD